MEAYSDRLPTSCDDSSLRKFSRTEESKKVERYFMIWTLMLDDSNHYNSKFVLLLILIKVHDNFLVVKSLLWTLIHMIAAYYVGFLVVKSLSRTFINIIAAYYLLLCITILSWLSAKMQFSVLGLLLLSLKRFINVL